MTTAMTQSDFAILDALKDKGKDVPADVQGPLLEGLRLATNLVCKMVNGAVADEKNRANAIASAVFGQLVGNDPDAVDKLRTSVVRREHR